MKIKIFIISLVLIALAFSGICQSFEIEWAKKIETNNLNNFTDVIENQNGGFTVTGASYPEGKSDLDFWMVDFNSDGSLVSSKTFGTTNDDYPLSIAQFPKSEYVIAGKSKVAENDYRALIVKTDSEGNEIWQKTINGTTQNSIKNVITFEDETFNVCGTKTSDEGNSNIWIAKFSAEGDLIWEKTFGENKNAFAESMKKLPDNGFVVAGKISDKGDSDSDLWIFRFDKEGEKMWDKRMDSPGVNVWPECICCSPDNNIVVVGWHGTCMNDINSENPIFDYDLFLTKISPEGKEIWKKNIDSEGSEGGNAIVVRPDGKIVVAGLKETSFMGRIGPWIVLTDQNGAMLSETVFPLNFQNDKAAKIINSSDGGLVVIGPGEIKSEIKISDGWIKKIKAF